MTPTSAGTRRAWVDPLVAGGIFVVALALIAGLPRNASDATDRVAFAAPAAAVIVAIGAAIRRRPAVVAAAALASATCVAPVLWPVLAARPQDRWSTATFGGVVGAIAIATAVIVFLAARIREDARGGPLLVGLVLLGMTLATPGLIAANGSVSLAQRAGPLAAVAVAGLIVHRRAAASGVVAFVAAALGGSLVGAWRWSELPGWEAIAVAVAMPIAWAIFELPIVPRKHRWLRVIVALLIAATPTLVAGVVAAREMQRTSASTGADEYGNY